MVLIKPTSCFSSKKRKKIKNIPPEWLTECLPLLRPNNSFIHINLSSLIDISHQNAHGFSIKINVLYPEKLIRMLKNTNVKESDNKFMALHQKKQVSWKSEQ